MARPEYAGRLRREEWRVVAVTLGTAQYLVREYHYAGGGANTGTFVHGLLPAGFCGETSCRGVAWWIPPTRSCAEASWPGDWRAVLSLSRLVLTPGAPKNSASFLLAASVRLVARDGRWRCLVTYADSWRGHTGEIYRVAGWEYAGMTAPEEVWTDPRGRMVARKAGPRTRTRAEMLALGCVSQGRHSKHKFRLILPPGRPRRGLFPDAGEGV